MGAGLGVVLLPPPVPAQQIVRATKALGGYLVQPTQHTDWETGTQ